MTHKQFKNLCKRKKPIRIIQNEDGFGIVFDTQVVNVYANLVNYDIPELSFITEKEIAADFKKRKKEAAKLAKNRKNGRPVDDNSLLSFNIPNYVKQMIAKYGNEDYGNFVKEEGLAVATNDDGYSHFGQPTIPDTIKSEP